jgi:small-conductance mechanosensitive channel
MSAQLLSGLSIQITQQFDVGDELMLEGGELGTVEAIGPLHTYIRGDDEIVTKISNVEIEKMRVSNMSLASTSQVKQILRFQFSALHHACGLVEEIKSKIRETTDKLITDGSRPFRVHWTGFGEEWLEVTVDCRLNIPPLTDEYYDTRQKILQAIAEAADECRVRFVED